MNSYWNGRVAVITGATHGICLRLAERLAQKGVKIATIYKTNDSQAAKLCEYTENVGSQCITVKGDVCEHENILRLIDQTMAKWGRIDFLINGIGTDISGNIADLTEEEWRLSQEITLNVPFFTVKQCLPIMREQKFGRIITMGASSLDYMKGQAGLAPFGMNKAALNIFTQTLALEEITNGITANMVAPGSTAESGVNREEDRIPIDKLPLHRRISRDEVTEAIIYFLSENAGAVTGQFIGVNGGCSV